MSNVIRWFITVIFLFTVNFLPAQVDSVDSWKLEKDRNGVKVFTRKTNGFKLKEFKAITKVEATPEILLNIIREAEKYPDWMAHLSRSHIVKKISDNELYIYSESDLPWPFSNRDIVTQSLLYWEGNTAFVRMTGISDFIPDNKGIVRMPYSNGLWIFNPVSKGVTEIIYQYQGDPGGSIPGWVANLFIVDGPYKTLIGMSEFALEVKSK